MLQFNPIFASHAVLAARKPLRIYGTGEGSGEISFAGQTRTVTAEGGRWEVEFPPMEYGGPYDLQLKCGDTCQRLEDCYLGEVYLMAGQSNMQFKLRESNYPKEKYEGNPQIRLFTAPRPEEGEPYDPADGWVICRKENAENWSALGYHVGQMRARKGIAVGLIGCYQGASVIESWLPEGTLSRLGIHIPLDLRNRDHSENRYKEWNSDGALYRKTLAHVFPYSLSAVVWYQGESNYYPAESLVYKTELTELIRIWRESFRDDELPFVVVQIADYLPRMGEGWRNIQKAQFEIQSEVPEVKTVISADVSESDNIHPPTKIRLAERISEALQALL